MVLASIGTAAGAVIAVIVLWLLPSIGVAKLAERKGRSFALWLVACLLFGWVWFLIAVQVIRPAAREAQIT
jgi:uncharacterized membrane protein